MGFFKYFVNHIKEMCSVIQLIISTWTTLSNVKRNIVKLRVMSHVKRQTSEMALR